MALSKRTIRWVVRLLLLAGALFMVLGGPLPRVARKVLPILSPLSALSEAVAQRTWFATVYWLLPPLAILLLAIFRGRFFCQWLCPLGTLYALPQKISLKKRVLPIRLNAFIFWTIIGGSLFGLPALLFLDPLSTFSRLGVWHEAAMWIPGALIPLFLFLSFFQPQVWCTHLCPLGYCFDLANRKTGKPVFKRDRRQFLAGLGLGGAAAAVFPNIGTAVAKAMAVKKSENKASILPPGATPKFAETCTRCYACVAVCPTQIIKVKKGGSLTELAMPELSFDGGACEEFCTRCTQVCPSGAIRELSEEAKRHTKIGEARIQRGKCLAWTDNEYCMVCHEFCPYSAIEEVLNSDGTNCPKMIRHLCRGCGACEENCPAVRAGKAILVHPLQPQQQIGKTS